VEKKRISRMVFIPILRRLTDTSASARPVASLKILKTGTTTLNIIETMIRLVDITVARDTQKNGAEIIQRSTPLTTLSRMPSGMARSGSRSIAKGVEFLGRCMPTMTTMINH
jgi:hypothetical protein